MHAGVAGEPAQQRAQVFAPALAEIAEQCVEFVGRQGRGCRKPLVVPILARQQRECDAMAARHRCELVDAVAPPVDAAEKPHQDYFGAAADALDPDVNRHRMAEVAQVGKPQARQEVALDRPCCRKRRKIAVGKGQHHDIAGRLAEIDRFDGLVKTGGRGRDEVHGSPEQSADDAGAVEALQTDHHETAGALLRRAPRPVILVCDPRAHALHEEPHRLAGDGREPFHAENIVGLGERGDPSGERRRIGDLGQRHDEAREIVMVVLRFGIVAGRAVLDLVLGADAEAEQEGGIDLAFGDRDDLDSEGNNYDKTALECEGSTTVQFRTTLRAASRVAWVSCFFRCIS